MSSTQGHADIATIVQQITTSTNHDILLRVIRAVPETVLQQPLPGNQDPLSSLDITIHTLGFLFILSSRLLGELTHVPRWEVILDFCARFDPRQARLVPERVTMLAKGIARVGESQNSTHRTIEPLSNLVLRFPPDPSHLTTVHPILAHACAATRNYAPILPLLLNHPISTIYPFPPSHSSTHPSSSSSASSSTSTSEWILTATDNLVYHYIAGVILAATKRYHESEDYFDICVSAPANSLSNVQLEAAKKLILVQLIGRGKVTPFPKHAHLQLGRIVKNTPYALLADYYPHKVEKMYELAQNEQAVFATDQNYGLVKQALARAPRWSIKKLTGTYVTLSLSDIARALAEEGHSSFAGDQEQVRDLVVDMIKQGDMSATISADGTIHFTNDEGRKVTQKDIYTALREAQEQVALLKRLEEEMERSREYLTRAVKAKDDSWTAGAGVIGMDMDDYGGATGVGGIAVHGSWAESDLFSAA